MTAPVLVLGAHRSGTSVLTSVLGALGLFCGARRDPNEEAWFFLRLNEWLLRQVGGRWDHPEALGDLLAHREVRLLAVEHLRRTVASPRSLGFLGARRFLSGARLDRLDEPWGFKDPRTTFTLPLWLEVFPDARVVHLRRHGVDVAASLRARQLRNLERSRRLFRRNRRLLSWLPKRAGFTDSVRCATLEGAFDLWEAYVLQGNRQVERLGPRAMTLSYEELTRDPRARLDELASFCGMAPNGEQRERAAGLLRGDRASAHREDAELSAFAGKVGERVAAALGPAVAEPELVTR